MTDQDRDRQYTMGRSDEETERLIEQSRLLRPITERFLKSAGLARGMRVLDIGSGAGDVVLVAAELVGPEGEVVGVDMNPEILETARERVRQAGHRNVEFLAGDVHTLELGGDFDALIGRLVLMYLPDPVATLKQLATRLRPRGLVVFQEIDFTMTRSYSNEDTPLMRQLVDWIVEVFERSGANPNMGLDLHRVFIEAGLPEPTLDAGMLLGGSADWPGYSYVANSFRSVVPLLEHYGIATAEEVDIDTIPRRVREEIVAAKRPVVIPPHIGAWARTM
ncbi:MAG: class I SAM-dependent methyltransferase [Gemmatimonadetes bacterium]|nr:class I SAM-dependent methyltransferase [Gemmatimonadota bacterium]MYG83804.1 class I SAM-dependent methyltransferase [Gemmatimonadota bacterium]MYJ90635.1 class I SAM-dependent methyltransferase [Gemmatimonadota bacterium]